MLCGCGLTVVVEEVEVDPEAVGVAGSGLLVTGTGVLEAGDCATGFLAIIADLERHCRAC